MNAAFHADIDSNFGHLQAAEHGSPLLRPPPPVLLHTEPPRIEPHPRGSVRRPSLLTALLAAESPCERHRTVRALLQALGFEWLACGTLVRDEAGWRPTTFCTSLIDAEWLQRYFTQQHHEVDPRWREALQSSLPCIWSLDQWDEGSAAPGAGTHFARFVADLRATGMQSGALLALPGRRADERWLLSLLSRTPGSAWIGDAVLGQLLTLSLCLHEFYLQHTRWPSSGPTEPGDEVLNPVQRDILLQLAHGASDKQIARELQLSSHAVDYHMRQLRRRFAARNRVQLTQAAQRLARR
jgi:DNA-binding CsgD family transcriptional regulator